MIELDSFLEGQQKIYDENFRGREELVRSEGVEPGVRGVTGGYYVCFRPKQITRNHLGIVSDQIASTLQQGDIMVYPSRIIHATLSDYAIVPLEEFRRDEMVLEMLALGVERVSDKLRAPDIKFGEFIYNQDAVLIEGIPNGAFVETTNNVIESCREVGIELRDPWGAHTTIARVLKKRGPEYITSYLGLMDRFRGDAEKHARFSGVQKELEIGSFLFGPFGLFWDKYKSFELK